MKLNAFTDDIPIVVILKAMGMESDQEIVSLVGSDQAFIDGLSASLEECASHKIFTQVQALDYVGSKIKPSLKRPWPRRAKVSVYYLC